MMRVNLKREPQSFQVKQFQKKINEILDNMCCKNCRGFFDENFAPVRLFVIHFLHLLYNFASRIKATKSLSCFWLTLKTIFWKTSAGFRLLSDYVSEMGSVL